MYRVISFLALSIAYVQAATAATPCPPSTLSIDGGASVSTPCTSASAPPPSQGGVRNGELFSTDFSSGLVQSILDVVWGGKTPSIISDATALSGRSLRFDWDPGFENYNGVFKKVSGTHKKLHARIHMKQGSGGTNGGIQKIIRFRPQVNGAEVAAGTINFQWGKILFFGDDYGDGDNHVASSSVSPDSFVNKWRYLEVMLDYSNPSVQHVALWVDGSKVLDERIQLSSPMPSTLNMNGVMFFGTFNGPATDRYDYIDKIDISANYMGVP